VSPRNAVEELAVGRRPRADLMPPEVIAEHRAKTTRRRLLLGLLGVVVVVALATGAATFLNLQSSVALAVSQSRTAQLLTEQAKYIEVRRVQEEISIIESGQKVGASTEIDWKSYLDGVQGKLPEDVVVLTVGVESASPLAEFDQSDEPLQSTRVATLTFSASTSTLPDVTSWLDGLATLPGFVDATPDTISLDKETGVYTAAVTMQIDERAWTQRFTPEEERVVPDEPDGADESTDDSTGGSPDETADGTTGDGE
jgi:Tfp pilus assembly protein PilN